MVHNRRCHETISMPSVRTAPSVRRCGLPELRAAGRIFACARNHDGAEAKAAGVASAGRYWHRLVRSDSSKLDAFRSIFGDERQDYSDALHKHRSLTTPHSIPLRWNFAAANSVLPQT
ncbi:MAG: putative zinc-binding metallopeptidase [Rhodoplanes sp.]